VTDKTTTRESLPESLSQLAAPPIFVVGLHRSGTTWVFDMLASHPEVAGVFESGLFSSNLGLATLFAEEHWYRDKDRLESDRRFFGASFRLNQILDRAELTRDVRDLSGRWLSRALGSGHRFLVEKTPQHLATMATIAELFPGAAFIHVIRDGRDMVVSRKAAARTWPGLPSRSVQVGDTAAQWAAAVRAARETAEREGLRYTEIRYEEIRVDPQSGLRGLFEFCTIPADDELVARICEQTSISKQRRGEGDAFRRRGEIGEWRESFGLRDRFRFDRAAGGMLVELGYEPSRSWWLRPRAQATGRARIA
jgi:sulfotransferase family protein